MLYATDFLARLEAGLRLNLPAWGIAPEAAVRLLTISENATYLVEDPQGGHRVFRVHRPGYHSRDEILSELAWIEALRRDGVVNTPRPIPGLDGALLQSFSDGAQERFAVCFEHVAGSEPDAESDLAHWFGHLGAITARLHEHARRFDPPQDFRRKSWTFPTILGADAYWGDWRLAPGLTDEGRAVLERTALRLAERMAEYGTAPDRFGLVHCDMRAANLLVDGPRMTVIDFDDCGFSWFGYDFAASVSFIEHDPVVPALRRAWLQGYRSVAPLDPQTEAMLPSFVMLRRLQLTAWIASHPETPTAQALGAGYTDGTVALARAWLAAEDAADEGETA